LEWVGVGRGEDESRLVLSFYAFLYAKVGRREGGRETGRGGELWKVSERRM